MNTLVISKPISLTERQYAVLKLVADGYKNEEIAKILFITVHTVKAHISAIYEILNVTSRINMVTKALKLGLIDLDEIK